MHKKAKSNGIDIAYTEDGKGEPLLLIMGLGAPGSLWEDHINAYSKYFRCIAIDNRGSGNSGKPPGPYSTKQMAEDAAGLLEALEIKKAHIIGLSMGGAIAQQLAIHKPDKINSLILISTWARCNVYLASVFQHFKEMRIHATPEEFTVLLQLWIFSPAYHEKNQDILLEAQRSAAGNYYMQLDAFKSQVNACISHDTTAKLKKINVPTLITVGNADIFTPIKLSENLHKAIRNSKIMNFSGMGHAHHWEDLENFNQSTIEFLLAHSQ